MLLLRDEKEEWQNVYTAEKAIQKIEAEAEKTFSKYFTPTSNFFLGYDVIFHQLNSISFHFPIDMTHNNKAKAFAQFSEK